MAPKGPASATDRSLLIEVYLTQHRRRSWSLHDPRADMRSAGPGTQHRCQPALCLPRE